MLNRPQYPQLSNAELSHNDGKDKKSADGPCESEKQVNQSCRQLITDAHKDCDINKYDQVQPCSSSICVAEYLADHVAMDSMSSGDSANPSHKKSIDVAESSLSDLTDSKKTIKFDDENDMGKYEGTELEPPQIMSEKAAEYLQGKLIDYVKPAKNEEEQRKGQQPMNELLTMESDMSVDHNFKGQRYEDSCTQVTQNSAFYIYWGKDDCNCTPRPLSETIHIAQPYEDRGENVAAILHKPVGNITLHEPEV
jgi:hypothetical protein